MTTSLILSIVVLVFSSVPLVFYLLNRTVYRRPTLPPADVKSPGVSVLIPARNEESNIQAAIESILQNPNPDLEVIVLDDHSTDATASIVETIAQTDLRVRLQKARPLPMGWCGKQHACHHLAGLALHPYLVFMDADVRLSPDALDRMVNFMECNRARNPRLNLNGYRGPIMLASGVPRQQTETFLERLLIPMIHFLLMAYLPMRSMRRSLGGSVAAGCGQLFIARADAYHKAGGHAAIRASLHDGVKLPRAFRKAGFMTGLFDATDIASCRMYHGAAETWQGLGKNAIEGLASPRLIGIMSLMLFLGQIAPWILLPFVSGPALWLCAVAAGFSLVPRFGGARRFKQSNVSALLHPIGVVLLLVIQWQAFFKWLFGISNTWKGRSYGGQPAAAAPAPPAKHLELSA